MDEHAMIKPTPIHLLAILYTFSLVAQTLVPTAMALTSLSYSSSCRPLLLGFEPSNALGCKPKRRAVLAARSCDNNSNTARGQRLLEDRIRDQLLNAEPSSSSYDTAWVAMVPAPGSHQAPRFPMCVDWILQNQRADGSWGPAGSDEPSVAKDALSSTMACVLALRTWGVGDELVGKGLRFIGRNSSFVADDKCDTPAGFNVIFPSMLTRGLGMGLEIPLTPADVDATLRLRDMELKSMESGSKAFKAYVAEGLGSSLDWFQAMEYQRKNGSFFNSPATTAAAAIHNYNGRAVDYLDTLISKFGSSVPTVYPRSLYSRLRMVDTLEKMGISPSYSSEINSILDMIYRSWLANDEEIMLDIATCAMAFRLLRLHGYDIPIDGLAQFSEESSFHDSVEGHLSDTEALLQLYKASQVQIHKEELVLENIGSWTAELLKHQLCSNNTSRSVDPAEVEHVLKLPFYATLDRLEHRRNIEHFKPGGFQMLKSGYRACDADEEIVELAADSFHSCQAVYQEELQHLKSWVKEMRVEELEFARVLPMHNLFASITTTMFPSELSEARIAWSKINILATVVDDLFDVVGTMEELKNLVTLIDMWDSHEEAGFCSERVEIVFRAVYNTSNEIGAKAEAVQNRSVIGHIAELWAETVRAMMAEAEWRMTGYVPSMEEYMAVGLPSFALCPLLPTVMYLVGPELPDGVVRGQEYGEMLRHTNICGLLRNDLATYDREKAQGKLNSVLLLADDPRHGGSVEAARREVEGAIQASRRELLRLVAREEGAVPRPCRALFWDMCKLVHRFYMVEDGYTSPTELMHAGNAVVLDGLRLHTGRYAK